MMKDSELHIRVENEFKRKLPRGLLTPQWPAVWLIYEHVCEFMTKKVLDSHRIEEVK